MRTVKLLACITAFALLASCGLAPLEEASAPETMEQTSVKEESTLFTADAQSRIFTFETNDKKYLGERGFTLWTAQGTNESGSFEPIEARLCKESGKAEAGFGLVFCAQEAGGRPFMLAVLINANGYYTAGKVAGYENDCLGSASGNHTTKQAYTYDSLYQLFGIKISPKICSIL